MYVPAHFAESRVDVLRELVRAHPLAALVTFNNNELNANHIPFEFEAEPAPFGTLRGHVARANPVWREYSKEVEALAIFQGAQHYITPSWYPTKREHGKVVPTFNYIVAHAYGTLRAIEDRAWLRGLVGQLTDHHESSRAEPWKVSDAPDDYVEKMLNAIVGIEFRVTRFVGKWKVSQNQPPPNRAGVIEGLGEMEGAEAAAMAELVRQAMKS
jgi:transcriptional regulator